MSAVIDSLAKHLQERVNKAEARVAELEAALRPFADAYRDGACGDDAVHTDLVHLYTRETYLARAAELVPLTTASAAAPQEPQTPPR